MDSEKPGAAPERSAISFPPNAVHLVRTNQQITMQLSQMADQKASILMGATFVVFTLAVGQARDVDLDGLVEIFHDACSISYHPERNLKKSGF